MRVIASGSNFLTFLRGGVSPSFTYKPINAQTGSTLTDDTENRETTNKQTGLGKNFEYERDAWSAECGFNIPDPSDDDAGATVSLTDLQDLKAARTKPYMVFAFVDSNGDLDTTKPFWTGQVLLGSIPIEAPDAENMTSTLSMQGIGQLVRTDPA